MQAFIRQKKIDNEVKINKEIPDIAGNLGYPPRFEPSYEQVKKATKECQDELKQTYVEQMLSSQQKKADLKERNLVEDMKFISGYRTAKNSVDFRHTTGNMGMLFSKTQMELDRLAKEKKRNLEVWRSS